MNIFRRLFGRDKATPPTKDTLQPLPARSGAAAHAAPDLAALPTQPAPAPVTPDPLPPTVVAPRKGTAPPTPNAPPAQVFPAIPAWEPPERDKKAARKREWVDRYAYGDDLWGISEDQRAAKINVARLKRFNLPALYTESDLADWLGVSLGRLRWFTHDNAADTVWHYTRRTIPKRSGGERVILAPKKDLKALQRKVLDELVARIPVTASAHGFVRGRSIVSNAEPHTGKGVVLNLDLKDFFPSVTYPRVRGALIAHGYPFAVASALALLCTEYDREPYEHEGVKFFISVGPRHLVQGAPTSPALANLVAWRLDKRLTGMASARGYAYTRYADDLTFSGDNEAALAAVRVLAQKIIHDEHFAPNVKKTRIAKQSARQMVTGLVVNDSVATPRKLRKHLRAILHNAETTGLAAQNREERRDYAAYLQGLIAHVHNASPTHAAKLRGALAKVTGKT
jgi:retron-type reverse transcriptase